MGGDHIVYTGDVSTKTADITTAKLMFNSVISTPNARFMVGNIKDFYLGTDMEEYECARIPLSLIPQSIIDLYDLKDKIVDGYVYAECRKGMYGLPQAGRIANDKLQKFLKPHGYEPCKVTHGLWKHRHSDLMFTLVVDDFGIRYTKTSGAEKLMNTLRQIYRVSEGRANTMSASPSNGTTPMAR
jgi:hypothetical protein